MKKFLKILALSLVLGGGVALVCCYIFIPTQTKCAIDIVMEYINRPLPIVGVSIVTLGGVAYAIVSKTSFGKKTVNQLKNEFADLKDNVSEKQQMLVMYEEKYKAMQEELKVALSGFNEELAKVESELIEICNTTPNAKVKALGEKIKGDIYDTRTKISEEITNINTNVKSYIDERLTIEKLEQQIKELAEQFANYGKDYGEEREETINE